MIIFRNQQTWKNEYEYIIDKSSNIPEVKPEDKISIIGIQFNST